MDLSNFSLQMLRVRIEEFIHEETQMRVLRSTIPYSIPRQVAEVVDIIFGVTSFPCNFILYFFIHSHSHSHSLIFSLSHILILRI
jgi:hypothetical protein